MIPGPFGTIDYKLGRRYTWEDVEFAALKSGVLRHVVDSVRAGQVSREDALCTVVMYLADQQVQWINEKIERASLALPAPIILKEQTRG